MSPSALLRLSPDLKKHRLGMEAAALLIASPEPSKLDWERVYFVSARKLAREAMNLIYGRPK